MNGMLKMGVTGTREGATWQQLAMMQRIMLATEATSLHHGDCIGADAQAHVVGRREGLYIVGYPPTDPKNRAWCECDELRKPEPYLVRDHMMVDETSFLVAMPKTHYEELRSGTWATVRYARKMRGPIFIIAPDGSTI